ncbi:SusC/RagA family TonB-linked outer membrane protein [Sphingobacterium hungaricum]|uniref:SusC/RagA family TonB-linked outer membrane protein n=1 Tax=Sphingobacterium hungaricum TaxID=2082723 RepID=A0A928YQK3_9SPHI|nr:SusC/RagA family TonB-linked outer membrane protein [Sphingobacterium hungaricum]MBE8714326.1 SusC/RagA family TonB-linked outer membrane protein [Sphingobacterium hungaricum]
MKNEEVIVSSYGNMRRLWAELKISYTTILAMKLTAIIVFLFCIQASANIFGQQVTLNLKKQKLEVALGEIEKQTGYSFLINSSHFKNSNLVTISANKANLKNVLDEIFLLQPFKYIISDKIITINPESIRTVESQQVRASGRVVDAAGKPLAGVTVAEVNSANKTTTDDDGRFSLTVSKSDASLRFTAVGFRSVTLAASVNMSVAIASEDENIDEVVITGFQKINKEKFTGSVSVVDKKNIDRSGSMDVSRMLQGAAAGVSVQNTSGTFGATPKIRIRGNSSISANQEPLYVINGVPITSPANVSVSQLYSGDPASVLGSAIAGLNAQDIEDIMILKDGAATALYGTRAANGVILITTKKGTYNSKNISISSALSVGVKPSIGQFNLMNSNQEMQLYKEMYDRGYLSNANWPNFTGAFTETYRQLAMRNINIDQAYEELNRSANANTNWFNELFRNNLIQEHSLSFSGGGDKHTYYVSGSLADDNGQAVGFGTTRYTTDLRTVFNITPKFDLDVNLNWNMRNQQTPGTNESGDLSSSNYFEITRSFEINPFLYAMNTSRAMYPYNSDGSYRYYTENLAPFNIIEELKENFNDIQTQEVRLIVRPTYRITKNLRFDGTYAIRKNNSKVSHTVTERSNMANAYRVDYNDVLRNQNPLLYQDPNEPFGYRETILPEGGFRYLWNTWQSFWSVRNQLVYNQQVGQHKFDFLVGVEMEKTYVDRDYSKAYGYMYYGGKIASPSRLGMIYAVNRDDRTYIENFQDRRSLGYYANLQYSFKDRYNFDISGRQDGSNMFGRMQRSKFLPNYGLGFAWNVEKEEFFEDLNANGVVDYLKFRVSHALRGNSFETSPMLNANIINLPRLDASNNGKGINVLAPELHNLAWEKDYTTNFAFDLSLYNRLTLTAEYYTRKNKDLVVPFNVAQEDGFPTKRINFGTMSNKGVDVTLGYRNVLNKQEFIWDVNLIYGYVKNELIDGELQSALLSQITNPNGYPIAGYPLEALFGFNYSRLNSEGRPLFSGADGEVNGIVAASRDRSLITYLGSRQPLGTGSVASSFQYKGVELRMFLTYSYGHKVFTSPVASRTYDDSGSKSGDLNYRWQAVGDENYTNIPGLLSTIQRSYLGTVSNIDETAYNRSDFRAADASNLRISEILLAYDLNRLLKTENSYVKNARLMLSANNIYYWASGRLRGVDPDLYLTGGTSLPNPRSFSMRLTVGF